MKTLILLLSLLVVASAYSKYSSVTLNTVKKSKSAVKDSRPVFTEEEHKELRASIAQLLKKTEDYNNSINNKKDDSLKEESKLKAELSEKNEMDKLIKLKLKLENS